MDTLIKFIIQCWMGNIEDWIYIHSFDDYESALKSMKFREKMDGHDKLKYRIVKATTMYEIMEESE